MMWRRVLGGLALTVAFFAAAGPVFAALVIFGGGNVHVDGGALTVIFHLALSAVLTAAAVRLALADTNP